MQLSLSLGWMHGVHALKALGDAEKKSRESIYLLEVQTAAK
jgi:hypothetical protein